jgi:hypothetical protein
MPTTVNLRGNGIQLGTAFVVSITYSAFPSVADQSAETPPLQAKYFIVRMFGGKNGNGVDFGQAIIDLKVSLLDYLKVTTIDDALAAWFPIPGVG